MERCRMNLPVSLMNSLKLYKYPISIFCCLVMFRHSGTPAVGCSYKAAAGHLYPLERGFIFVHKPPIHIRFEELISVNFARSGGSTRYCTFNHDRNYYQQHFQKYIHLKL